MRNQYLTETDGVPLPVPEGTKAGEPVKIGALVGVAATDRGAGGNIPGYASVLLDSRAYDVDVDGQILEVGTRVYVTDARTFTTTASGNTLFGHTIPRSDGTLATKASGVGKAIVRKV